MTPSNQQDDVGLPPRYNQGKHTKRQSKSWASKKSLSKQGKVDEELTEIAKALLLQEKLDEMKSWLEGNEKLETALIRELSLNWKIIPPSPYY